MRSIPFRFISGCISLIALSLFFTASSPAAIDLETAVGIWLFDDGGGDVAADSSGKGNDGTLVNGPAWVDGQSGMALEFNGTDNCVQTGQKLLDNLEEFTVVAWVRPGNITANRVGLVGQNDSPEFGFIDPATVNLWTPTAGGLGKTYEHAPDEWHHVAAVASTTFTRVYIDGVPEEGTGDYSAGHGTSDFTVNIGGCGVWDPDGNWFTGSIDEVAIFQSALEDADIVQIMEQGLSSLLGPPTAVEPDGKLAITWGHIKKAD